MSGVRGTTGLFIQRKLRAGGLCSPPHWADCKRISSWPSSLSSPEPPPPSPLLYVHWPFCARRCSYCNFNKYVVPKEQEDRALHDRMTECLVREARTLLGLAGARAVRSVFFGGGTPSRMPPGSVRRVLEAAEEFGGLSDGAEVTLEANPAEVVGGGARLLRRFRDAGVNRLSLGVQSFQDYKLGMLNRDHDSSAAAKSLSLSSEVFPGRFSADLIFGLPGQTLAEWREELRTLMDGFSPRHVSAYQLTLERGTSLWKSVQTGEVSLPKEDLMSDMYDATVDILESYGLSRYEVSNFAASEDCKSAHNRGYWSGGEYVGVGPGAHGRFRPRNARDNPSAMRRSCDVIMGKDESSIDLSPSPPAARQARIQTLEPPAWMREVELAGHGTRLIRDLSAGDVLSELLAGALRTREGLERRTWRERAAEVGTDVTLEELLSSPRCRRFAEEGTLVLDGQGLRLTREGTALADGVLPYMLICLEEALEKGSRRGKAIEKGTLA